MSEWIKCDSCPAQAKWLIRFVNKSDVDTVGGLTSNELSFCNHHLTKNKQALDKVTLEIVELNKTEEVPQLEKAEV